MRYDGCVPHRSKSFRFVRNVGFNLLGQLIVAAVSLLAIPYLVHRMGTEAYGLYILMHTVASYLLLSTLGAATPTSKFVAEFNAAKNASGLRTTLRYSLLVHAIGPAAAAVAMLLCARFLVVRVFHVPPPLVETGVVLLRCAATATLFLSLLQFCAAILQGLQRFDWQNLISVAQNGLMPIGAAALFALGLWLTAVGQWYIALSAGVSLAALAITRRLLPAGETWRAGPDLSTRTFALYSLSLWLSMAASCVTFQFDKIFLARGTSLSGLTLYAVPAGLLQRLAVLPAIIASVLMPMISEVHGPAAEETLRRMYVKSAKFLLWAALPVYALLFALMPQFLSLWLGGDFGSASVWPARLLVISQTFFILTAIPNSIAAGRGRPWYTAAMSWAQAVLSVVAWKLLIPRYQLLGVAAGSLIAQALPTCVYLAVIHRRILGLPLARYLDEGLRAPLVSAGLLLAVVFPLHAAATSWIKLVSLCAGACLIFYASTWLLLNAEDRDLLKRFSRWESRPNK